MESKQGSVQPSPSPSSSAAASYSQIEPTQQMYQMSQGSQMSQDYQSDSAAEAAVEKRKEQQNPGTFDTPLFDVEPKTLDEYSSTEDKILEYFTDSDCRNIIRTLDILYGTFATAINNKKYKNNSIC